MSSNTLSHVGWHIFGRQLDLTACILEGAVDYCMGAFRIHVLFQLPQFSCPLTTITAMGTVHVKLGEGLLQPLVGKGRKK